jgi:hypothetical protein
VNLKKHVSKYEINIKKLLTVASFLASLLSIQPLLLTAFLHICNKTVTVAFVNSVVVTVVNNMDPVHRVD